MSKGSLKIFLCGDLMLGRGIDQIMHHPSNPQLFEPYVKDARDYIALAQQRGYVIPQDVKEDYVWGAALDIWKQRGPDLKIVNLETSITLSDTPWPGKGIHYRMHPDNRKVLTAAGIDLCVLANNHILDWGEKGLYETISSLDEAGIQHCGAGETLEAAQRPAIFKTKDHKKNILIFSFGLESSGILRDWAATKHRPGVWLLEHLDKRCMLEIKNIINNYRQGSDICIASIHWGGNWGYTIPMAHQDFAHALIDDLGIDLVHGHSSHHPIGIEIYHNKVIFYGCGDFINDYEGIGSHEEYRKNLSLMYFLSLSQETGDLRVLSLIPLVIKGFSLNQASKRDKKWLLKTLWEESNKLPAGFSHLLRSRPALEKFLTTYTILLEN